MSENKESMTDLDETSAEPTQDETVLEADEAENAEADLVLTPEEAEEEIETPHEDRVFGLPRMCFHGVALGIAAGYILTGLYGVIMNKLTGSTKMPSSTMVALVCAGIGYLITKRIYDKKKKAEEAAAESDAE
ncbi:hypothetical protein NE562_14110 [Butyricicoccus faecihominis]|uniref:hypothetical protein n=1 Tax=Butyricicoccaceae TaxID=3085642 RepID=UPI00247AACD6|nr:MULTISPECIES: hypothetical protein [Butyricicoccaceae]MCQ5130798.1 hypothetical protein [Butyricicoccus faecihominis]WNX85200.1 hypothetical protein RWV98_02680 [Agathobaculum sp. NTUH-O15-33]